MAPKARKGKGVTSSRHENKRSRMLELSMRMQAYKHKHQGVMGSIGSRSKKERSNQVNIRKEMVNFSPDVLNRLVGSPSIDPKPFKDLILRNPHRAIRHTLSGLNSVASAWKARDSCYEGESVSCVYFDDWDAINVGVIIKDVLRRVRAKKEQRCHAPPWEA
ncbi:hypothetical protein HAX54_037827 [Datura stramonium]|uniref:Uncharacterized protein n=1 Tax=Datura stramonium TaxID=4076 RepID=A0ABS8SHR1_DATST|nr:hypothetical protein [Datura stramonium]